MNNSNFNTNIDDYNIEDLLNLLELNDPTKEEIIEKVEFLNNNFFNEPQHNNIRSFFFAAQNKLLNDFTIENNYINNNIFSNNDYNTNNFLIEPMANLDNIAENTNNLNNSIKNLNLIEDNIENDLDNNPDNNPDMK